MCFLNSSHIIQVSLIKWSRASRDINYCNGGKDKASMKKKIPGLRKLKVNFLNRNKEGAYSLKYVHLCSNSIPMLNPLKMINGSRKGDLKVSL